MNQFILDYHPNKIITYCCLDKDNIQDYIKELNFKLVNIIEPSTIHFNKNINQIINDNHSLYSNYQSIYNSGYNVYELSF